MASKSCPLASTELTSELIFKKTIRLANIKSWLEVADDKSSLVIPIYADGRTRRWEISIEKQAGSDYLQISLSATSSLATTRKDVLFEVEVASPQTRILLAAANGSSDTYTRQDYSWVWSDVITFSDILDSDEVLKEDAAMFCFTIHEQSFDKSSCISSSIHAGFVGTPTDVAFVFRNGKKLFAHKNFLATKGDYFRTMFKGDFAESHGVTAKTSNFGPANPDDSDEDYVEDGVRVCIDIDDDTTSVHGNTETQVTKTSEQSKGPDSASGQTKVLKGKHGSSVQRVAVHNFAYVTYKNLLSWIYTRSISFKQYTPGKSKRNRQATSPRSLYALADMLGFTNLKAICLQQFKATLTLERALSIASSRMLNDLPELKESLDTYIADNAKQIIAGDPTALTDTLSGHVASPEVAELLVKLFKSASSEGRA